jgi:hypothetical protein
MKTLLDRGELMYLANIQPSAVDPGARREGEEDLSPRDSRINTFSG